MTRLYIEQCRHRTDLFFCYFVSCFYCHVKPMSSLYFFISGSNLLFDPQCAPGKLTSEGSCGMSAKVTSLIYVPIPLVTLTHAVNSSISFIFNLSHCSLSVQGVTPGYILSLFVFEMESFIVVHWSSR